MYHTQKQTYKKKNKKTLSHGPANATLLIGPFVKRDPQRRERRDGPILTSPQRPPSARGRGTARAGRGPSCSRCSYRWSGSPGCARCGFRRRCSGSRRSLCPSPRRCSGGPGSWCRPLETQRCCGSYKIVNEVLIKCKILSV